MDKPAQYAKSYLSRNTLVYGLLVLFGAVFVFENRDHFRPAPVPPEAIPAATTAPPSPAVQLYQATAAGDLPRLQGLLEVIEPGAINQVVEGMTPIMLAASMGNTDIMRLLLAQGADPNVRGSANRTALQYAAERNHLSAAQLLLANGADINGVDDTQLSPLVMAADRRYHDLAMYFIEQGADVNLQHVQGWTALIDAARHGDLVLVKRLIQAGADPRARTQNGWTALEYAQHNRHTDVVNYLQSLDVMRRAVDPA